MVLHFRLILSKFVLIFYELFIFFLIHKNHSFLKKILYMLSISENISVRYKLNLPFGSHFMVNPICHADRLYNPSVCFADYSPTLGSLKR